MLCTLYSENTEGLAPHAFLNRGEKLLPLVRSMRLGVVPQQREQLSLEQAVLALVAYVLEKLAQRF